MGLSNPWSNSMLWESACRHHGIVTRKLTRWAVDAAQNSSLAKGGLTLNRPAICASSNASSAPATRDESTQSRG